MAILVVLGAAAAVGGWYSTSSSSSRSGATSDAQRLLRQSLAAARAAGSFHYVSSSIGGGVSQLTVGDAGATEGRQEIDLGGHNFTVLVVGADAFFRGDAPSMVENLFMPPALAQAHAGQWISLSSGDPPYQSVYAAVTTGEAIKDNITFSPQTVLDPTTLAGQRVVGVRGAMKGLDGDRAKGTATLYVSATSPYRPVRYVEQGTVQSGGSRTPLHFQIDFSAWGQTVSVAPPAGAIAFSSLGVPGGPPPGSNPSTVLT